MKKIAFLDFETNGFQGSEVLSMSLRFNYGTEVNRFYFPKDSYNEQAISINGLTKEKITQLRANADYANHFIDDKDIIAIFQEIDMLVAHNTEFDYSFLPQEIKDMNFEIMDTMKANTKYFQKNPKLGEASEFYGIELIFDNLHGSAYDAEICEKIYNAMSEADKQPSRLYLTKVFAGRDENGDLVMPFGSQKGITAKKMTEDDARNFFKKYDSSLKHEMYELVLQRLHELSAIKFNSFFDSIKKYITYRDEEITSGKNDYNMVNVVRKENAEVGMHSNVIYSLIDPDGLHYRGKLFLNLFIQHVLKIKIDDFGEIISVRAEESTTEATVKNRRVDFTIKSTNYYVGIEMKIDATDSLQQVSDYEKDLKEKSKREGIKNVHIFYLTKDGRSASDDSLYDKDKKNKTEVINISFKKHITEWIESCQEEVKHIQNLHLALENYKDVVKKITGQYKGNLMTFEDYLEDKDTTEINRVLDEIDRFQENVSKDFLGRLNHAFIDIIDKEPGSSLIDIPMGQYYVRLYFNLPNSTLLLQIGDRENRFISVSDEKRNVFREKYLSKIKLEEINLVNLNWSIGYGEINIGKVRFQTLDSILKDVKNITSKLSTILRNE